MALDKTTIQSEGQSGGITGNTVNVNLFVSTPLNEQVLAEVQETLVGATKSKSYAVLLCPPSQIADEEKKIFSELQAALESANFEVYVSNSPESDSYCHFTEADFVASGKCNSVVVFAKDIQTIAQLNIYTFLKKDKDLAGLDIPVIQINFPQEEYFSRGCLAFINDGEKIFSFQELNDKGVHEILEYLSRRRTLSYRQTRGIKKD